MNAELQTMKVAHLTSMHSLEMLAEPLYDSGKPQIDIDYFCKKIRISRQDLEDLLQAPIQGYSDFASWYSQQKRVKKFQYIIWQALGRHIEVYSQGAASK